MWPSTTPAQQPDEATPQVKRFACDRCHDQKLRCTRPEEGQSCVRCARAGVHCNVSAAQRTGRPRKSSRPQSERKNTAESLGGGGGSSDSESRDSAASSKAQSRRPSAEQIQEAIDLPQNDEVWDTFVTRSSSSVSPASFPSQPYAHPSPLSTDDYAELLDCITDPNYFDNMDLSSEFNDPSSYFPNLEPNPKKRKSNPRVTPMYSNQISISPPILENKFLDDLPSACITSFPEIEIPLMTPAIITPSSGERTPDIVASMSMSHIDTSHSQTLSSLQSEIDACSERILYQARRMSTASTSYTTENQKLSEALGVLLSTAEQFIELISNICRSFDPLNSSRSPSPSPWAYQQPSGMDQQQNYFSSKMFSSHRTNSLDPSVLLNNRELGTSTFYTMLKCHIRLLSAYDTTLDTMASRLLELEHLDAANTLTSALAIGSFVVPFGAIIETLLHLQVISHQLDRLKTALHGNLLKLQPQRQAQQGSRSLPARLGLCRQGRSPSVSMVDFKLEEIAERERALQTKLLRIENLAESSKQGQINGDGFSNWA